MKASSAVLALFVMVGCVSTQTTAVKSAAYEGVKFRGVLVDVPTNDLTQRQHYENAMVTELANHNIRAVSAMRLFPPTDTWTAQEVGQLMARQGLDTVLWIQPAGESHSTQVIGQYTTAQVSSYGNTATGSATTTNITRTTHTAALEARLVVYDTSKTVWMAQSQGQGSAKGMWGKMGMGSDVVEHIAGDIGSQIADAQIFAVK